MPPVLDHAFCHFSAAVPSFASVLAQVEKSSSKAGFAWAIILLCVFLGLIITLRPTRRTSEIKRPKDDY